MFLPINGLAFKGKPFLRASTALLIEYVDHITLSEDFPPFYSKLSSIILYYIGMYIPSFDPKTDAALAFASSIFMIDLLFAFSIFCCAFC